MPDVRIDIYEKYPIPHGLVRYGVAPDHPEVKMCMNKFDQVAADKQVRYFGNVEVGMPQLPLERLRSIYDAVVLCYGAAHDRRLGIEGEDGWVAPGSGEIRGGIISARDFVNWYNGHPAAQGLAPDLQSSDRAIVIGQGNVALDVARILLSDIDRLSQTDITEQALETLRGSRVRHVDIVGRRGPLQVAFTIKELREMVKLPGVSFSTDAALVATELEKGTEVLARSRPLKRMMELLDQYLMQQRSTPLGNAFGHQRSWSLQFLQSPVRVEPDTTGAHLQKIVFERNRLEGSLERGAGVVGTGELVERGCGIALRSIGYASVSIEGAPFDERRRIIPNIGGRVVTGDGEPVPSLYVSGWLKRGPTGVIAATMQDAYQTADTIAHDIKLGNLVPGVPSQAELDEELERLGVMGRRVTYADWKRLEQHELEQGRARGKPREKVTDIAEMLAVIRNAPDVARNCS
ncbi:NADPH-adrenodoxin reductase [Spiromyces aspiralis]|uniref:NADPH-adrenodoxin reductase n=1 Tax=Spiromyces aspiralis TaxID=68401 RepID=A0ACC1HNT6_9FUNG|nr:NADPH-adrenodoxin reductase [Spiromyces aspiralis]